MSGSLRLIAHATWFWRDASSRKWIAETGEPQILPALLGPTKKRLSVWLPSGTRVVCRPGIYGFTFPYKAYHFYARCRVTKLAESKIEFFVRELNDGEQWPSKPNAVAFKLEEKNHD